MHILIINICMCIYVYTCITIPRWEEVVASEVRPLHRSIYILV